MEQVEKLKKYIEKLQNDAFEEGVKTATKALSTRHGEWRIDYDYFHRDPMDNPCYCSICKSRFHQSFKGFPYCPVCGSKMDKEV